MQSPEAMVFRSISFAVVVSVFVGISEIVAITLPWRWTLTRKCAMQKQTTCWIGLCAVCFSLLGCGGDETKQIGSTAAPTDTNDRPPRAELVIEASESHLLENGEQVDALRYIDAMLPLGAEDVPAGFHAQLDPEFERDGQRLISISQTKPFKPTQAQFDQAADELFAHLKIQFDAHAKKRLAKELTLQRTLADSAAAEVAALQKTLQVFQESRRGLPATSASRLERRKLDRQIETTLQSQIDANSRIEALQRKIDRGQSAELIRVR